MGSLQFSSRQLCLVFSSTNHPFDMHHFPLFHPEFHCAVLGGSFFFFFLFHFFLTLCANRDIPSPISYLSIRRVYHQALFLGSCSFFLFVFVSSLVTATRFCLLSLLDYGMQIYLREGMEREADEGELCMYVCSRACVCMYVCKYASVKGAAGRKPVQCKTYLFTRRGFSSCSRICHLQLSIHTAVKVYQERAQLVVAASRGEKMHSSDTSYSRLLNYLRSHYALPINQQTASQLPSCAGRSTSLQQLMLQTAWSTSTSFPRS